MSGPVDVLETLAGWCNEHGIGKAEYERRSATYAAVAELIEDRRLLADALSAVITMLVNGHQLQDRLQFSDTGRAILTKIDSARDAMAAALANIRSAK